VDDHPDILRWQNDPEIFYWMDYEHAFTLADIHESEQRATEEGHPFIIEFEGRGIGRIGLNNFRQRDGLAAMYIFIGERDVWGHHIGLDSVLTILRFGFELLDLRLVELWMLEGNERARKLYKQAGFIEEARLADRSLKNDTYVDHVWFVVDRDGYENARASFEG
jgi:RimJ/RimL family protein N-acetyltransferase